MSLQPGMFHAKEHVLLVYLSYIRRHTNEMDSRGREGWWTHMPSLPSEANLQAKIATAGSPIDPRKLAIRMSTPVCNISAQC